MNVLLRKLWEAFLSVFPFIAIVLLLHFTLSPVEPIQLYRFLIGAVIIILGLALFLFGVDLGIDPIGQVMGSTVAKTNRIWVVIAAGMLLGFFVSVAEPDLHILAGQVDAVTSGLISKLSIITVVSIGIAVLLAAGFIRILYNYPLNRMLTVTYIIILVMCLFSSSEFMSIAFDASGATTGAFTVPFILALALGVSSMKKDSKAAEKDSFGLVGIASAGAIMGVLAMSIVRPTGSIAGTLVNENLPVQGLLTPFFIKLPIVAREVAFALAPIVVLYLVLQMAVLKQSRAQCRRILLGCVYAFVGLVIFLTSVGAGFMEVGAVMGYNIAAKNNSVLLVGIGFALGLVTVLAEPAVHALTNQIEAVTAGYVKRKAVLAALSLGIGLAVALSMLRILIPGLKLWHILLPGYIIALALTYIVPKLFVGIAFDAGGVASGPMTATFILAYAQGAAEAMEGAAILLDGFGVIALVALTPPVTLQILGLIYRIKSRKGGMDAYEPTA